VLVSIFVISVDIKLFDLATFYYQFNQITSCAPFAIFISAG